MDAPPVSCYALLRLDRFRRAPGGIIRLSARHLVGADADMVISPDTKWFFSPGANTKTAVRSSIEVVLDKYRPLLHMTYHVS